jgi:hypothetical protein
MRSRNTRQLIDYAFVMILLVLLCIVCAKAANATDLTVKCTAPTTNTDGSPIDASATITFNVYGGMQGTSPLPLLTPTPLSTCSRTATKVNVGVVCYAVSAVETINGVSAESAQTVPVCTTVSPPTPAAPTNPAVTVSVPGTANTAYILEKSSDNVILIPAGTVPAGTACDSTQTVTRNGSTFAMVPHSAVTWTGSVTSLAAFAKCS